MNSLAGRVALVTGGGRDVGAGISKALAEAGAAVAVNYHSSKDEAEAVVAQINKAGGKAKAYQADIANLEAVRGMVAGVKSEFGGLDILVNNAGLVLRKRFVETTPEDWHRQIDVCLYGAIHCCHAAAPLLEASGRGRIISIMGDLFPHRRIRPRDRRGGARGHHCADEVAGARNGTNGNDGQFDRARPDRVRA